MREKGRARPTKMSCAQTHCVIASLRGRRACKSGHRAYRDTVLYRNPSCKEVAGETTYLAFLDPTGGIRSGAVESHGPCLSA